MQQRQDFPWWLLILATTGAFLLWRIVTDDLYAQVANIVSRGVGITIFVTLIAFIIASLAGLGLAMMGMSKFAILRQIARLYIEIVRGVPILVLLLYIAFVAAPLMVSGVNSILEIIGADPIRTRDFDLIWRAIMALSIAYAAFIAEIFRAGIEAVDKGQAEAARTLGLTPFQTFRVIILPQAIRTILPPLGNDFISLVKDSALVSVLGVADITQLGKVYAAGSFRYLETYNIVAYVYLVLTICLSLGLRGLEKRLSVGRHHK